jgi:hypothetical protein
VIPQDEILRRLRDRDVEDLVDILGVNSTQLVDRFNDVIIMNYDEIYDYVVGEETLEDYDE